jgi:TRAP transporter TAXI family solute receptor
MGTAAAGGAYQAYGPAWGRMTVEKTGIPINYRRTDGPSENIFLMHQRVPAVHLSMVTMEVARQAWLGLGPWTEGRKYQDMRALFPMYETAFHGIALKRTGIERLAQLQHKSIGVGPRGSTSGTYFPLIMNTLGVPVSTTRFGEGEDLSWQLEKGLLDAFLFASGVPTPHFTKLADRHEVTFLDFAAPELEWLGAVYTNTYRTSIDPGKYRGQEGKLNVLGTFNFAVGLKTLPDDFVYETVKTILTHQDTLAAYIREIDRDLGDLAKQTSAVNLGKNEFLPYHPGAARYLKETGVPIPENLDQC